MLGPWVIAAPRLASSVLRCAWPVGRRCNRRAPGRCAEGSTMSSSPDPSADGRRARQSDAVCSNCGHVDEIRAQWFIFAARELRALAAEMEDLTSRVRVLDDAAVLDAEP